VVINLHKNSTKTTRFDELSIVIPDQQQHQVSIF